MNKEKAKVFFIMHMPPPIHGAAMVGKFIHDSYLVNEEFTCQYMNMMLVLRGKLRSVANFMIRSVVSSGLDGSIKFNFLSKVKKIMLEGGYTAYPYLSFSDFFKVVIINLPTKLLCWTINLYLLLKK